MIQLALLTSLLLCLATAVWAATPAAPPQPAVTAPAASPALPAGQLNLTPPPILAVNCQPVTTCTSCFYEGFQSAYQCFTYCVNGVPHRSCGTCAEGCNQ